MQTANNNIPRHVAVIMDGNGRWANNIGAQRLEGHKHGVDSVRSVVREATDLGVEYLTIYAFSTENWGRPQQEVDGLMELLAATIMMEIEPLKQNGVKLHFIGQIEQMPQALKQAVAKASDNAPEKIKLNLVIALNYSARQEITGAVRQIAKEILHKEITPMQISEKIIEQHLQTAKIPDPDLLIRTSGEQRLSNFLLWQLSYTELYFTNTLWPDFDAQQFRQAVDEYQTRSRRYGKL